MKKTPLPELVERIGQSAVAKGLGVSAPAISKALRAAREILVTEHEDGTLTAEEIRPFPCQLPAQKSAA
ncbi:MULTISPECIES: Cro/CI family transcriptional regulator [Pseudomonas]|uniref:Cro/CI family transcriptional regulator n=1 Tax=Pseudomonas TaxID=286 RepID=UPI0009C068CC|nr:MULTISPECIES: Cro/CI family transcriptional regulator [Pseudomonas]MDP9504543.1 Cro/CI family transcriptional regulator [Pseudomonas protegens]POA52107.1 Cro/Cl family transcriptional regulator [Pseudomonas sp. FW507-12TSA]